MNYYLTNGLLLTRNAWWWRLQKYYVIWFMTNKLSDNSNDNQTNCRTIVNWLTAKVWNRPCLFASISTTSDIWKLCLSENGFFNAHYRMGSSKDRLHGLTESVPKLLIIFFRCSISAREWWAFSFARISSSCLLSASLRSWISFNSCIKNISLLLLNVTITTLCIINRTIRLLMKQ